MHAHTLSSLASLTAQSYYTTTHLSTRMPEGWRYVSHYELGLQSAVLLFGPDGFYSPGVLFGQAYVAYNSQTNQVALVFRGTDPPEIFNPATWPAFFSDFLLANVDIPSGRLGETLAQFNILIAAARTFAANNNSPLLATGHSLGGALAELLVRTDPDFNTGAAFGAPGLPLNGLGGVNDFVHVSREQDLVGTLFPQFHTGQSIWIDDRDFSSNGVLAQHDHYRYETQVGIICDSPIFDDFGGPDQLVRFLRSEEVNYADRDQSSDVDYLFGGNRGDEIDLRDAAVSARVDGGAGDDYIIGTRFADRISGGAQADRLIGGDGDDYIWGGSGSDQLEGQTGLDHLFGGEDGDTYHVGVGQGYDIIDDRGGTGEDVLVLYTGQIASVFDPSWFTRAPDNPNDLLIRIPNGPSAWHVDIRIVGAGTPSGGIETIQIRSGISEVVTASTSLADIWLGATVPATPPPPVAPEIITPGSYSMSGGSGRDLLNGTSGTDTIVGLAGYDRIFGHGGNDTLLGGSTGQFGPIEGDPSGGLATPGDVLDGGDGDDVLLDDDPAVGRDGDYLFGGNGDDTLIFYGTSDSLDWWLNTERGDGGAGNDIAIVDYRHSASAYSIRGSANGDMTAYRQGAAGGLVLTGCETITFLLAAGDDVAVGGVTRDRFFGGAGNDQLDGGDGDDVLDGGDGNDQLTSGSGVDWLDGGSGTDRARLDLSDETRAVSLVATSASQATGFTLVDGTHVRNVELIDLYSGSGADRLTFSLGLTGQHFWAAGAGADHLTIDQSSATTTVTFSVNSDGQFGFMTVAPTGAFGFVGEINFTDVDRFTITGGSADDYLNGAQLADELSGGRGDDRIFGNGGDDTLRGGLGDDTLTGGLGNDWLDGGAGHDIVTVSGDFASYRLLKQGDDFVLKGPDGGDRLTGVESIRFGDGRVLELSRLYGPDVDTRAWADGRIPEALLSGGAWDEERPLVLPGPAGDDVPTAKDGGGPEVLPAADDGDGSVWKNDDAPLVLPGAEDDFVLGGKGFDGPEVLPGMDDWTFTGAKGFDQPEVLPELDERTLFTFDRVTLLDRWSGQMLTVDEQGLVVDHHVRGGWGADSWSF